MAHIRKLEHSDETEVMHFLVDHQAESMFLRNNMIRVGISDGDARYHGHYVGAFEAGKIVAVAASYWNDMIVIVAPSHAGEVIKAVADSAPRVVAGLIGPSAQVQAGRMALGLCNAETNLDNLQDLYHINLTDLVVPKLLEDPAFEYRAPLSNEMSTLINWRTAYHVEALRDPDTPEVRGRARKEIQASVLEDRQWVLTHDGEMVSSTAFNARLPDCVQVGGVYTPPELRARGYARAAVAGSLLLARKAGVMESILFTGAENESARKAYLAIGFRIVGDYRMTFFKDPVRFS